MTVGAILLAAGSARRMGEDKLAADLGGKPLIVHALEAIAGAGLGPPIVAVAPGSAAAQLAMGHGRVVEVADHVVGMGRSLAAAVEAAPSGWTAAIVGLADMPFVRPGTWAALALRVGPAAIVRPRHDNRPGHPVLWGRRYFPDLAALTGDEGGRGLFARYRYDWLDSNDPGVLFDVDTPEGLAEARRRLIAS